MNISILTLFPEMFNGPLDYSIVKHARENKKVNIRLVNIRDFGIGRHKIVDDKPYGGGTGMVLRVDVLHNAILSTIDNTIDKKDQKIYLLDARGETFNQQQAKVFSALKHLILICGHYEGVDERINHFIDAKISIGNFILTGGELPAMLITDAVTRLIEGVLKPGVTDTESFSLTDTEGLQKYFEYPHYTRPEAYNSLSVPEILLSGNHLEIARWKRENAKKIPTE